MASPHPFTPTDMAHLRRTIALAAEALEAGDAPFGSVLVDAAGTMLREDRNRIRTAGDGTRHPELELARWAAAHVPDAAARKAATVYTSGEHCAMCAAAHAWVGLGRIVYVASAAQLDGWMEEFRREKRAGGGEGGEEVKAPVATLPIQRVAPGIEVAGPVGELEGEIKGLHRRYAGLATP